MEKNITRLDETRDRLLQVAAEIDATLEIYPGWKLKEVLAHIAGWDAIGTQAIERFLNDEDVLALNVANIDAYNAQSIEKYADSSMEQVLTALAEKREAFKAIVLSVPDDKHEIVFPHPWQYQGTVKQMVNGLAYHDKEHTEDLEEFLGGK